MAKLLYIKASPRIDRSYSVAVADCFVAEYKRYNPSDEIETMDIFKKSLPDFGGPAVEAKYVILHGKKHSAEQAQVWKSIEQVIADFKSADKYVLAVPMWNFGIPWRLKQYIDIIVQPGYTFTVEGAGYKGLVKDKPLLAVYSRGGDYSSGQTKSFDLQKEYIELIFAFLGFENIRSVVIEPTLAAGADTASAKKAEAIAEVKQIARHF